MVGKRMAAAIGCLLIALSSWASAGSIDPIEVSASSAVLIEAESGRILFEKNARTPRPMASTTKIMTALLAAEALDPERVITVRDEAVRVEGTALGLRAGYRISVRDLITGLLLCSGNDAANTLALEMAPDLPAFARRMNERAKEIGMTDTTFVTPSGLDEGGHASSARDMALLAREALAHPLLAPVFSAKTAVVRMGDPPVAMTVSNHNKLLDLYPDAIGMKTGFTKKAGRCLVSAAKRDGITLIAVTLNAPDDWNDHIRIYETAFSALDKGPLPGVKVNTLPVIGGTKAELSLSFTPPEATLTAAQRERVAVRVELPRFVWAGVKAGEVVGRVRYFLDDRELTSAAVCAASDVDCRPAFGFWKRMGKTWIALLRSFFTDGL